MTCPRLVIVFFLASACATSRPTAAGSGRPATSSLTEAITVVTRSYALHGRFDEAEALARFGIERAQERKDLGAEALLHAELGRVFVQRRTFRGDESPDAPAVLRRAQELAEAAGHRAALATALDGRGMLLYWRKLLAGEGEWQPIIELFERGLALREALADSAGMSESIFHLGLTEQFRNQPEPAQKHFERALELAREAGDDLAASYAVRHLGALAEMRGDLGLALELQQESLRLREAVGFRAGVVHALIAVGMLQARLEPSGDAARSSLMKALRLANELQDAPAQRSAEGALGTALLQRGEASDALVHLERALELADRLKDRASAAGFLVGLGEARARLGQREQALSALVRARELSDVLKDADVRAEVERVAKEHTLMLPSPGPRS